MLTFQVITNYLYMAKTEFVNHTKKFDFKQTFVDNDLLAGKSHLLYVAEDRWAPLECMATAQNHGISCSQLDEVTHAFIEKEEETLIVTDWTID